MNATPTFGRLGDHAVDRRRFLGLIATGAAVVGIPGLLTACSTTPAPAATNSAAAAGDVIPKYIPVTYIDPDYPSVNGSVAGLRVDPGRARAVREGRPGHRRVYTAMTPLWGTIPPTKGNKYYEAVNELLGSDIQFQITDGNVYGDKLATVLASAKDVPDWVCIPTWNLPPRFGSEIVENVFQDLTPYLAGDKVTPYPNLANIPSDAWKFCVFNGKLYGLPFPGEVITDAIFYRRDVLESLGITPDVEERPGPPGPGAGADRRQRVGRRGPVELGRDHPRGPAEVEARRRHAGAPRRDRGVPRRPRVERRRCSPAVPSTPTPSPTSPARPRQRFQSGKSLITNDGVGGWHEAMRDNLASNPAYWQQPFDPFDADGGTPVLWKGNPANIFSFIKKTDDEAQGQGAARDRERARGAVRHAPSTTRSTTASRACTTRAATTGCPVPTDLAATELQPTYIFLVDPPIVGDPRAVPGLRQGRLGVEGERVPVRDRTRCSTRSRSSSRSSTRRSASRSSTWRRTSPAGARAWTTSTRPSRRGRRPAATSCGRSTRTSWTSRADVLVRAGPAPPPCGDSRGGGAGPAPVPHAQDRLARPAQARPVAAAHGDAGDPAARRLRLRADARQRHRVAGLLAVHRVPAQPVRRLGQLRAGVHQPGVPERGREHAGHHGVPAGVLLPDPDLPGAAAQQRDHAADRARRSSRSSTCRTSSRGCWW